MINKPISKKVVPRRIRAEQVGTIINLIRDESSLIEFEDLVDVTMDFSNAASKEKIRAFGNLIKTCPKIERLTICFESRENHYREASDRVLPSNSPIWQSLENLNLKYLSLQSGILPSDLIR